jgi:hypothetical protein
MPCAFLLQQKKNENNKKRLLSAPAEQPCLLPQSSLITLV